MGNDLYGDMSGEDIVKAVKERVAAVNKTLPSSKAIRRIRIRKDEFEKTTSKKIKRAQSVRGDLV